MLKNDRYTVDIRSEYIDRKKEYSEISEVSPATYLKESRYSKTKLLDYDGKYRHTTPYRQKIQESEKDLYVKVDNTTENRLDIIAHKYYGHVEYWWVAAVANNIIDPFDIPVGTVLRLPPVTSLYLTGGVLDVTYR